MDEIQRITEQLFGRLTGPMYFRLLMQPIMSIALGIRAGLKDARENKPAFLWEVISNPIERKKLIHSGWRDLCRLFILALVLDTIYQVVVLKHFYILQALLVASVLAFVPYILTRGPVTRIYRRMH
jgi:hypothetical protein